MTVPDSRLWNTDQELVADALAKWCEGKGMPPSMVRPHGAAAAVLDALVAAGWLPPKEAKKLRTLERMATRHAHTHDRDIAEAEARVLELKAQVERLRAREAQRHIDAIDQDRTSPDSGTAPPTTDHAPERDVTTSDEGTAA